MDLFVKKNFISHAGKPLSWKIECNALSDEELEIFAELVGNNILFSEVIGVPTGGLRFAQALEEYRHPTGGLLIVDDVLTTGGSMEEERLKHGRLNTLGVVIFNRGPVLSVDHWIKPIIQLNPYFHEF